MSVARRRFAYRFYWITGLVMLALWVLDLWSGGEVSLQLTMFIAMAFFISLPILLFVFVIPSAMSAVYVLLSPRDPLLLSWSLIHLLFWLFILNNALFFLDSLVVSRVAILVVWGTYAITASSLPVLYRTVQNEWSRLLIVLFALGAGVTLSLSWDPQLDEFNTPFRSSVETEAPDAESLALLQAATEGDLDEVRALLRAGANLDARDEIGWDALHIAVFEGHTELVDFLLNQGADSDSRGFQDANKCLTPECKCSWLIGGRQSVLDTAVRLYDAPMVERLIRHGAQLKQDNPLVISAAIADMPALNRQIKSSSSSEIDRALRMAASGESIDVLRALLDAGGDPNAALWNAAEFAQPDNISLLLERGGDPNNTNYNYGGKGPPLMSGLDRTSFPQSQDIRESAHILIAAGAEVNHIDPLICGYSDDVSVLIMAVHSGNEILVRALLEHGADPTWRDRRGKSALDHARALNRADIAMLIEQALAVNFQ